MPKREARWTASKAVQKLDRGPVHTAQLPFPAKAVFPASDAACPFTEAGQSSQTVPSVEVAFDPC